MIGTLGTPTAFSFCATKKLTTGEGGMLTDSSKTIVHARISSLHGTSRDAYQRHSVAHGNCAYSRCISTCE